MDDELAAAQELTLADLLRKVEEGEPALLTQPNRIVGCRATAPSTFFDPT